MSDRIIAVNLNSYGAHRVGAFPHLESLGVRHVEIPAPAPEEVPAVAARLRHHGLTATSCTCPCDLSAPPESMLPHLEAGRALGTSLFFISTRAGDLPKPEAYRRLRARCELAGALGITLSLETHPDLGENAGEARATLLAVGHPALRWNLDTANLYYYNPNIDAVEQARRGRDLVASVHLKDTNGGYRCWWFPALGEGVVDFPGVFRVLEEGGFRGPYALELEGIQGEAADEALVQARVARSMEYLRGPCG